MCIEAEELARMHSHKFSLFLPMTTGSFICVILPVKTTLSHSFLLLGTSKMLIGSCLADGDEISTYWKEYSEW